MRPQLVLVMKSQMLHTFHHSNRIDKWLRTVQGEKCNPYRRTLPPNQWASASDIEQLNITRSCQNSNETRSFVMRCWFHAHFCLKLKRRTTKRIYIVHREGETETGNIKKNDNNLIKRFVRIKPVRPSELQHLNIWTSSLLFSKKIILLCISNSKINRATHSYFTSYYNLKIHFLSFYFPL